AAVAGIFAAKGRPPDHPLIVHVVDWIAAQRFAIDLNIHAQRLIASFWPGPVTLIVPRKPGIATAAAGGQPTIGLRCPAHPVAQALLQRAAALGVPGIAAPSANRFGRVSPTQAAHVLAEFGEAMPVLDGGDCALGIESSIIDCSRELPVLLRPGVLTRAQIEATLGEPLQDRDAAAPRASGDMASHYAPRARVRLFDAASLRAALHAAETSAGGLAVYSRTCPEGSAGAGSARWRQLPDEPATAARELFALLREWDAAGVREIWIEQPPDAAEWEGVRDRLRRAAAA
ncbi:L-threonylcarbamoyladenylate synthase, partial [Aquabacterium sp.]|uniref:L-threonylcarbamoyladenylate synthase n=1 Tax=Aquabacterium sp. TaxID=1872578 RepID=UPI002BEF4CDD